MTPRPRQPDRRDLLPVAVLLAQVRQWGAALVNGCGEQRPLPRVEAQNAVLFEITARQYIDFAYKTKERKKNDRNRAAISARQQTIGSLTM